MTQNSGCCRRLCSQGREDGVYGHRSKDEQQGRASMRNRLLAPFWRAALILAF